MLKRSISAAALVAFFIGAQAGLSQAADFPDIMGVWAGTYDAAFPVRHGHFANQKKAVEMELRVTKQDDNLFWAENRWRVEGLEEWVTEDATGTLTFSTRHRWGSSKHLPILGTAAQAILKED